MSGTALTRAFDRWHVQRDRHSLIYVWSDRFVAIDQQFVRR